RAPAARTLVRALRERFDLPVHLHTHDTPGGQLATLVAAIDAGVDAVDAASAALAGTTSQPPMSALVAATNHSDRTTGLDIDAVNALEPYWEATRRLYAPFESGLPAPTGRVYRHEIPGGQLSNLRQQAVALGLGEKFEQIEDMYAAANDILGNVVKVTPSSKVVGDLALHLVAVGADPAEFAEDPASFDIPDSVIGFLSGELGDPPGGWPEPFRTKALEGRTARPQVTDLTDDDRAGLADDPRHTLNRLLFPGPTDDLAKARAEFGDLTAVPTDAFLYGMKQGAATEVEEAEGNLLLFGVEAVGEADERGIRNVLGTINGQLRPTEVRDRSVDSKVTAAEKAEAGNAKQIAVPFAGVVHALVAEGDVVEAGQTVATIEAMKMEASITTASAGTVERLVIADTRQAEGGDLLLVLAPS
ncbi:MAG: pyruvate carboxylase, partial [Aeromicrobium sp.]|nr:pyruvate carboxylase [Aeromicrobium sp.]